MNRLEHVLAAAVLRVLRLLFDRLPIRQRVVLATARLSRLEGNLAYLHAAITRTTPDVAIVALLDPYSYGILGKLGYLLRMARGMYYLRTSSLFIVDNAYLPVHVAAHRPGTTVVQVWHAVGAFKRFGADTTTGLAEPEQSFLHRYYDYVICAGDASRAPYAAALRTPIERVLPLGVPRTDYFLDERALAQARERIVAAYPGLRARRVVLYAPTFRGRGRSKHGAPGFDAVALRAALPADHVLALKTHPNLDPRETPTVGFDVVLDPALEINEVFAAVDVLVTDYSSSVFEWALLRRPLVVLTEDLAAYERDPGLYLDPRTELIGRHVDDPEELGAAILDATVDDAAWSTFIARNLGGCDGHASGRFVERFLPAGMLPRASLRPENP
jgi:CDP-glycerol glycerophosphotransferase (TagB/SpsB family)